jgi:hypothetical protein
MGDKMKPVIFKMIAWVWFIGFLSVIIISIYFHFLDRDKFIPAGYGVYLTNRLEIIDGLLALIFIIPFFLKTTLFTTHNIFKEIPFKIAYFILPRNKRKVVDLLLSLFIIVAGVVCIFRGIIN